MVDPNLAIPVLMYHEIVDMPANDKAIGMFQSPYFISLSQFEEHIKYLFDKEFNTVTIRELIEIKNNKYRDHKDNNKLVAITFDDGYSGNFLNAFPILKKFHFKATFFVIVNRIGTRGYMNWNQLKELQSQGMEIQSHTLSHRPLEILSLKEIRRELYDSKHILQDKLMKPIHFVSYPHGSFDRRVLGMAIEVGYVGSCTSDWGYFTLLSSPYEIKRIIIRKNYITSDIDKIIHRDRKFVKKSKAVTLLKRKIKDCVGIKNYMKIYDKLIGSTQPLET